MQKVPGFQLKNQSTNQGFGRIINPVRRQPTDDSSDLAWLSRLPEKNWSYHLLAEWWGQIHLSSMEDPALIPSTARVKRIPPIVEQIFKQPH